MIQYSIGELIDKLVIVNLKLWHTEEHISELKANNTAAEEIEKNCNRVVAFNKQRMDIIESINELYSKDK